MKVIQSYINLVVSKIFGQDPAPNIARLCKVFVQVIKQVHQIIPVTQCRQQLMWAERKNQWI